MLEKDREEIQSVVDNETNKVQMAGTESSKDDLPETECRWNEDGTFEIREEFTDESSTQNLSQSEKDPESTFVEYFESEIKERNDSDQAYLKMMQQNPEFIERKRKVEELLRISNNQLGKNKQVNKQNADPKIQDEGMPIFKNKLHSKILSYKKSRIRHKYLI